MRPPSRSQHVPPSRSLRPDHASLIEGRVEGYMAQETINSHTFKIETKGHEYPAVAWYSEPAYARPDGVAYLIR